MEGLIVGARYRFCGPRALDAGAAAVFVEPQPDVTLQAVNDESVVVTRADTGRMATFSRSAFEVRWELV